MNTRIEVAAKVLAAMVRCGGGIPTDEQIEIMVATSIKAADALLSQLGRETQ